MIEGERKLKVTAYLVPSAICYSSPLTPPPQKKTAFKLYIWHHFFTIFSVPTPFFFYILKFSDFLPNYMVTCAHPKQRLR